MERLVEILVTLTTLVTLRKLWYDGTKSRYEGEKAKLENERLRREGD